MSALLLTCAASMAQNEWTGKVKNPSFESGTKYWTLEKSVSGSEDIAVKTGGAADGAKRYNIWAQRVASLNVFQTISLPAGTFILTAQVKTNTQGLSNQHIYATTASGTVSSTNLSQGNSIWEKLSLTFTLDAAGDVTIGAASTGNSSTEQGWINLDDFRLWSDLAPEPDVIQTVGQVTTAVSLDGAMEYHVTDTVPFTNTGSIDIVGIDHSVVFFDNLRPSEMKNLLSFVKINGKTAVSESNCQLRLYDHGTVLYPYGKESKEVGGFHPLTVYTEQYCQGVSCDQFGTENTNGFMNSLTDKTLNNRIRSFRLKRGYMVTFAVGVEGYGYQRCFIADDQDLVINTLPAIMDGRISSYRIFRWDNVGKNGVANILDTNNLKKLNSTWTYAWGTGKSLGSDYECVPHMNNLWSASTYSLGVNDQSPYLKTDNEPANGVDPYPASVAQVLERWPELMRTGRRLLSPTSWDGNSGWHQEFFDNIDARGWRCDVLDLHCYWTEGSFNNIKGSWADKYHRPVWITEFIWGASWSGGTGIFAVATTNAERGNPSAATLDANKQVLARIWTNLNNWDYVERYAYWNDEWPCSKILWGSNLTPAGDYYSKMKTGPSYSGTYNFVPTEWRCAAATGLLATYNAAKKVSVIDWRSYDCDLAESISLQRQSGTGAWQTIKEWIRPDSVFFSYEDSVNEEGTYAYRVVEKTWKNTILTSATATMSHYLVNGSIMAESKSNIKGWTCERNASNGNTKADSGDTYLEVYNSTADPIDFNYYQDVTGLPNGVYKLTAVCFNSTNGVSGATVNGHVGLYALADGIGYFTPVTKDSEIDYKNPININQIVVRNGKMRIGIRNIGKMTARWAGADNFQLTYLGTEDKVLTDSYENVTQAAGQVIKNLFDDLGNGKKNATGFIGNADCSRGTNTFWTVSNLGITSGQAYDGDSNNQYFDKWSSGSLTSYMQQTLNYLPAGRYSLSALLRGTPDISLSLQGVKVSTDGIRKIYTKIIKGIDGNTVTGSEYQRGWQKAQIDIIDIAPGDQLTIYASATAITSAWWGADHFQLAYIEESPQGIENINTNDSNEEVIAVEYYDLMGCKIKKPENNTICIMKKTYASQRTRSEKIIVRKL